jgi:uncharacterized protein involved in outer membrane biogenesis
MRRLWIGLGFALIGGALAVALIGYRIAGAFSPDALRPVLERELTEGLGLEVEIAGTPRIELFPVIRLVVEDVRVASPPGRPSPSLLRIGRLDLEVDALPLLQRMIVVEALELSDVELRIEPDIDGSFGLRPEPDQLDESESLVESDPIRLEIHTLAIRDLEISFDPYGEGDVTTLAVTELLVESDGLATQMVIEARGSFEGGAFEILAETGSLREFLAPSRPFPIDLEASFFDGRLEAKGTLGDPRTLAGAKLRLDLSLADPALRARELGIALPPLGAVSISCALVEHDGSFALEQISAHSRGAGALSIEVEGDIRDVLRLEGVDVQLSLDASDVGPFEAFTSLSLPGVPLRAEFDADDEDGSLGVEADVELSRPGIFELDLEGAFDDLRGFRELDLKVGLKARTLSTIVSIIERDGAWQLPVLGPVEATGRLVAEGKKIGLQEIEIHIGDPAAFWVQAKGSVRDVLAMREVDLEVRTGAASASRVAALFDRTIAEVGGLTAAFSVRDDDGSLGIENATFAVERKGEFKLEVKGAFDDLADLEEIGLEAVFEARDLSTLGGLFETELPAIGPLRFEGSIRGAAEQMAGRGRITLPETSLEGDLTASFPTSSRPAFDLRLRSPRVHLPDLLQKARSGATDSDAGSGNSFDMAAWWRGEEPLPIDMLGVLDATFEFEVERVTGYEQLRLGSVRLSGHLEDGHLVVDEFAADYEAGRVGGRFEIDARPQPPESALELEAFNVDLTQLFAQFQPSTEYAGLLDLSIKLDTEGTSAREMRSNLQGFFGAMLRDGAIVNRYSKALSFDVMRVSIPSFSPTSNVDPPVHCLLAVIPIEDGIATLDTLYLEGEKVTITGAGEIDLGREQLAVKLTPHVREPGLLSISANVGLSGSIANPEIRPTRRSLVTSALGALYRNAMRAPRAIQQTIGIGRSGSKIEAEDPCGMMARQRVRQIHTKQVEALDLDSAVDAYAEE